MHPARLKWGVACVVYAALMSSACGQGMGGIPIAVAPVVVKMDTSTEFSSVEISNRGDLPTSVEVKVVTVKWVDGREQYEPTHDFTVSPPVFRMQAGKSRIVRFKYDSQRQDAEGFYRLFIHQIPPEANGANQITMVFNLGVPIFIAPRSSHPALSVHSATGQGKPAELYNNGNVTLTIAELEGQGCPASPYKVQARLSPAQKLVLKDSNTSCATSARTDQGVIPLTAK